MDKENPQGNVSSLSRQVRLDLLTFEFYMFDADSSNSELVSDDYFLTSGDKI
jgi:hypothetical protein